LSNEKLVFIENIPFQATSKIAFKLVATLNTEPCKSIFKEHTFYI